MEHVFCERIEGGEVVCTDETLRIEIVFYSGIAPVNGNGVDMEGIDQFFRGPTRMESVSKARLNR